MRKLIFSMSILALLILAIVPVSAQDDTAAVRLAHFSPDAPAVDIYVDGELAIEDLAFTEVTEFLELDADSYEVAVTATGDSIDDAVIGPLDVTLEAGATVTIAAVGSLDDGSIRATVIEEDYSPIASGSARITVVHAIEGESAIDVYGSSILLIQALRYPSGSGDGAFTRDVPAGRYNFEANVAESDATIRVANGVEIEEGEYYLIVAIGPQSNQGALLVVTPEGNSIDDDDMVDDDSSADDAADDEDTADDQDAADDEDTADDEDDAEVVLPSEGTAMLRLAHFSPDAPAVDIYIDGALVVEGLEFPEVTPFFGLAGDSYEVTVTASGDSMDDAVMDPVAVTLEDDSNTTVAAVGSVDRGTITVTIFEEDYSPLASGTARVTVVHAIEGESAIDVFGSGILLIQALRYPDLDSGRDGAFTRDVPAGRYNFAANISETDTSIRVANGIQVAAGDYIMVVALGPQSNSGELLIVTPDGYENPDD